MQVSEWATRKAIIDTQLKKWGWTIIPYKDGFNSAFLTHHAIEEYPTTNGRADYALFVKGRLLGILEAKKVGTGTQNVLEQAKRYAAGFPNMIGMWNGFVVPFLYASNGENIFFADVRDENYYSREVLEFHTPDTLEELFERDYTATRNRLTHLPFEIEQLRPYQKEAVSAIENAIAAQKRKMMLAMATGTGKTITAVSMIYRMIKSGYAKRILFLVDRRALAAQAAQTFSTFKTPSGYKFNQEYEVFSQRFRKDDAAAEQPIEEDDKFDISVMPNEYLTSPKSAHTFVYVSTIQRMAINLFGREGAFVQDASDLDVEDDTGKIPIPIHAFDIIIADECHRGYTSKDTNIWRAVLNHFDAVKIGLTATPAAHTVGYFGKPVYHYTVEQAVLEGFLVDYQAIKIKSDVRINGIFLKEGEKVALKNTETGKELFDELEDERTFDSSDIERKITSPDSNKKIIAEVAKYAKEHEMRTGHFPKTLIFASNDIAHRSHADDLVLFAREIFERGDDFVQKITGSPSVDRPLEKIKRFRNRPEPGVVVTVDMLSTGVDIPELEFIVFLRPVKSRILWTQMLGRGTRKCDDIHKEYFTVFDCFDGSLIEYFKGATDFDIDVREGEEAVTNEQIIDNIWNNIEPDYNVKRLIKRLRRVTDTMSANARQDFSAFIAEGDIAKFTDNLCDALKKRFSVTMEILRNKTFQDLLTHYDRAFEPFYVAVENVDMVVSQPIFKYGDSKLKPEDYLNAFSEFIKQNKTKIDALSILFSNPHRWNCKALNTMREALKQNEFDENVLQKAHAISSHKAMTDIISCVKYANDTHNPLLTAEERVDRTIGAITAKHKFTEEQMQWLGYIRKYLVANLAIEKEIFDTHPILERHGGLTKAKRIFGSDFDTIIDEINTGLAA